MLFYIPAMEQQMLTIFVYCIVSKINYVTFHVLQPYDHL